MSKLNGQRLQEWESIDDRAWSYHQDQWDKPKESTIEFEIFVSNLISNSKNIIDLGAGSGAATASIASKHPNTFFTAFDYSKELISIGKKISIERGLKNIFFKQGDWFKIKKERGVYDGVISLQTLSWLPDCKRPLSLIFKNFSPRWVALTSLFYEGDITCKIEVDEHIRDRKTFYNIYSLPAISRLCQENGYTLTKAVPFEIKKDIDRPADLNFMGTYTRKVFAGGGVLSVSRLVARS